MIETNKFLQNIVTDLSAKTWTSKDSSGTSGFVKVYEFPKWTCEEGYPFLVVMDKPQSTDTADTIRAENQTNIEFNICGNHEVINEASEGLKKKEVMLRIREAYDFLRSYLLLDSTVNGWLTSATRSGTTTTTWRKGSMSYEDIEEPNLNLIVRRINLPIFEFLNIK